MSTQPTVSSEPFFSIVIPTLNEEKHLPELLKNLVNQTNKSFEVIHVDGNSSDATLKKTAAFSDTLDIHSITVKKRNVAHQRNTGSAQARGKWVLFLDADTYVPNYFLDGIKYQLAKHPGCDLFTCLVDPTRYALKDQSIITVVNTIIEVLSYVKPIAQGAMIGMRAELAKTIQFNETMAVAEDYALVETAVNKGHKFVVFKEPRYSYSLRRLEKEGLLKITRTTAEHHIKYFLNKKDMAAIDNYPMLGGEYYEKAEKAKGPLLLFKAFRDVLKELPSNVRSKLFDQ